MSGPPEPGSFMLLKPGSALAPEVVPFMGTSKTIAQKQMVFTLRNQKKLQLDKRSSCGMSCVKEEGAVARVGKFHVRIFKTSSWHGQSLYLKQYVDPCLEGLRCSSCWLRELNLHRILLCHGPCGLPHDRGDRTGGTIPFFAVFTVWKG